MFPGRIIGKEAKERVLGELREILSTFGGRKSFLFGRIPRKKTRKRS